jgi:hypothetical protein
LDAALEGWAAGYMEAEVLLRGAGLVIESTIPIDPEYASAIARPTGAIVKLATHDDAGRAVQRWLAAMAEPDVTYCEPCGGDKPRSPGLEAPGLPRWTFRGAQTPVPAPAAAVVRRRR